MCVGSNSGDAPFITGKIFAQLITANVKTGSCGLQAGVSRGGTATGEYWYLIIGGRAVPQGRIIVMD